MPKRLFAACAMLAFAIASAAQDFPTRAITIAVPFGAGGPTDTVARLVAQSMMKSLGQTMIVENVGGAGGTIGVEKVAHAKPDGYTLLLQTALKDPDLIARFAGLGSEPVAQNRATPEALRVLLKSEIERWSPIIKKAGVYAD
jgi:tripartite-type tricarboxylate transporter receptor subunit TctC